MTPVMDTDNSKYDGGHAGHADESRADTPTPRGTSARGAASRARILEVAGRLFKEHGFDAVGVDAVMREAGLTHGGFYAHFPSKEALAAEAASAALSRSAVRWEALSRDQPDTALARIVESYLDPTHVAAPARGCMLTALGPEVARRPAARPGVTAAIRVMFDALARCLPGRRRDRAIAALCTMVGAVVLARASDDAALADEILRAARDRVGAG